MSSKLSERSLRVVVVHPSEGHRKFTLEVLSSAGFERVQSVTNIEEVFQLLEIEKIDWIISPVFGENEYNLIHLLQTILIFPELKNTRVSAFLENQDSELIPSLVERGLIGWFPAPEDTDNFTKSLKAFLNEIDSLDYDETLYVFMKHDQFLESKNRHEERIEAIHNLMRVYPGQTKHLIMLAKVHAKVQKFAEVKLILNQILALEPEQKKEIALLAHDLVGDSRFLIENFGEGGGNILGIDQAVIIDPDAYFAGEVEKVLKDFGVPNIKVFQNGHAAWDYINSNQQIGLILMEWKIPGLTGPLLLQRNRHKFPGVPIVILTENLTDAERPLLLEMGVSDIIKKPCDHKLIQKQIIYGIQNDRLPKDIESMERKILQHLNHHELEQAQPLRDQFKDDPDIPKARKIRVEAEFLFSEERYAEARDLAVEALRTSSDSLMLLNLLGKCFLRLGDYTASLKCFEKAQLISPMNLGRLCEIAVVKSEIGLHEEASEAIKAATDQDPTSPAIAESSAKVAIMSGDLQSAKEIMNQIESLSDIISYMNNRAVALAKSGKSSEGVELYRKTHESIPNDRFEVQAIIKYNLGLALIKESKVSAAKLEIQSALDVGPSKIYKKAKALLEKIEKASAEGRAIKLNNDEPPPPDEIGSPTAIPVKQENMAIVQSVEKNPGEIGCYKIVRDAKVPVAINVMAAKKAPRYSPSDAKKKSKAG